MNRFRLLEPMEKQQFELLTGLAQSAVQKQIDWALEKTIYQKRTALGNH